jgi:[acyl-carrier-protein] S-malonyltransferase
MAGHSVGELTAAAAAGILSEHDAMTVVAASVALRWRMLRPLQSTGMSAVIGADEAELLAKLDALGLEPANFNGGGQIVVAGDLRARAR